jgi:hypothetical protein
MTSLTTIAAASLAFASTNNFTIVISITRTILFVTRLPQFLRIGRFKQLLNQDFDLVSHFWRVMYSLSLLQVLQHTMKIEESRPIYREWLIAIFKPGAKVSELLADQDISALPVLANVVVEERRSVKPATGDPSPSMFSLFVYSIVPAHITRIRIVGARQ